MKDGSVSTLSVKSSTQDGSDITSSVIGEVTRVLSAGGSVSFSSSQDALPTVRRTALFGGLLDVTVVTDSNTVTAKKAGFAVGSGATLSGASTSNTTTATSSSTTTNGTSSKNVWTLGSLNDMEDGDGDDGDVPLVDEDALLARDPIAQGTRVYDCGVGADGARKACKDCTCGLADEEQTKAAAAAGEKPKSGCGNCSLGDAFRCASCPSLGMPAWQEGDKVKLKL